MSRLVRGGTSPGLAAALAGFEADRAELARRLGAAELGDGTVVVVPSASLTGVPWGALPPLVGRPVTVAPSATRWCRDPDPPAAGRPLFAAGPGLPHAEAEVRAIAGGDADVLTGDRGHRRRRGVGVRVPPACSTSPPTASSGPTRRCSGASTWPTAGSRCSTSAPRPVTRRWWCCRRATWPPPGRSPVGSRSARWRRCSASGPTRWSPRSSRSPTTSPPTSMRVVPRSVGQRRRCGGARCGGGCGGPERGPGRGERGGLHLRRPRLTGGVEEDRPGTVRRGARRAAGRDRR